MCFSSSRIGKVLLASLSFIDFSIKSVFWDTSFSCTERQVTYETKPYGTFNAGQYYHLKKEMKVPRDVSCIQNIAAAFFSSESFVWLSETKKNEIQWPD
jgi:hypothetical protein